MMYITGTIMALSLKYIPVTSLSKFHIPPIWQGKIWFKLLICEESKWKNLEVNALRKMLRFVLFLDLIDSLRLISKIKRN